VAGGIQPRVIAIGIALRDPLAYSGRTDLQAQDRADELAVEAFTELGSSDADVTLQSLASGGAQLPDPLVLQNSQRWQEYQQGYSDKRRPRRFLELHQANINMHKIAVTY